MNQPQQMVNVGQQSDDDADAINLASFLDLLLDNRWLIAGVVSLTTMLGAAYAFISTPIYQANILVQVEDGSAASHNILGDLAGAFDVKSAATAEIEILRSRLVVTRAVENVQLDLDVQPKYFPIIGHWIARHNNTLSVPGLFGFGGYVWGTEAVKIGKLDLPRELEGEQFELIVGVGDKFVLKNGPANIQVTGRVGENIVQQTSFGLIGIRVDTLTAKPGAEFLITRTPKLDSVELLQNDLAITERGKQSGIIGVSLEGPDPERTALILNEIGKEYIRQNVERKSEEAEKSLDFLDKQLPQMKASLERAESRYNAMRNSRGTVDLDEEAKAILQESVVSQTKLIELQQKKDELLTRFQDSNPLVQAVDQQIRTLKGEIKSVNRKIHAMPSVEQEVLRLTRDVKVNTDLYTSLLNSAQQLRLVKASKVGNARLLDAAAVPLHPVRPKRALIVLMSTLLGGFLGVLVALLRKSLFGGIEDPHEIEQHLGLSVTAAVPFSPKQAELYAKLHSGQKSVSVLATQDPGDSAIESLRSFRTSLQFSMIGAQNKIVMITGPTPGVGKSFISVNFAAILAAGGKKLLLIDADLRKGYLNKYFGLDRAELLGHANFRNVLEELSGHYDYIVIDTAPVLAVADSMVVAPLVGAVFQVVRSGVTTIGEIEESVKRLNRAGNQVAGVLFNGLRIRKGYGYGAKYGKYRYTQYKY
jgi:tyrosine-protein kinase Etk/Wzc